MVTKKSTATTTTVSAKQSETKTSPDKQSGPTKFSVVKLTKMQNVKAVAEKLAVEAKQVQTFFDVLAEMATKQTRETGEFTIPGLGKRVKAERKQRMSRNLETGEPIEIAAKVTVKFRIAKAVTDAIAPPKSWCTIRLQRFRMNSTCLINGTSVYRMCGDYCRTQIPDD